MVGQTVLLVAIALLVAQALGFLLIVNERDRWRMLDAVDPAIQHFVGVAQQVAHAPETARSQIAFADSRPDEHYIIGAKDVLQSLQLRKEQELQHRLLTALRTAGVPFRAVAASSIGFSQSPQQDKDQTSEAFRRSALFFLPAQFDPMARRFAGAPQPGHPSDMMRPQISQQLYFAAQLTNGQWINGQFLSFSPPAGVFSRLVMAEIVLFAIVLGATLLLAMRLARPMAQLAAASESIGPDLVPIQVPEQGPRDIREAIRAFNMMAARVAALLREKDHMLGALGHDLRTPLATLRIRADSIEPEAEREKIVEIVKDMTLMVDDILDLARLGHSSEPFARVDIAALADAVVEEFKELGHNVAFAESRRSVVRVQTSLVRRLLRNLIDNAVKYGTRVEVSVVETQEAITLVVRDHGPGIPQEQIPRMLEPFTRLEESRNRDTGGSGIGLSIAAKLARSQGAKLVLTNNSGLVAEVIWPARRDPANGLIR